MKLLQITDRWGGTHYILASSRAYCTAWAWLPIPLYFKTGYKYTDMPKGLRPECCFIQPENIESVSEDELFVD